MDLRGRGLLAHEAEGYEEWGASGSVTLDPGSDGLGLWLNVRPGWRNAESGTTGLWDRSGAVKGQSEEGTPARLETELGTV